MAELLQHEGKQSQQQSSSELVLSGEHDSEESSTDSSSDEAGVEDTLPSAEPSWQVHVPNLC